MSGGHGGVEIKLSDRSFVKVVRQSRVLFIGVATIVAQLFVGYMANKKTVQEVNSLSDTQMQTLRLETERDFAKKADLVEMNAKLDQLLRSVSRLEGYVRRRPGKDEFWSAYAYPRNQSVLFIDGHDI